MRLTHNKVRNTERQNMDRVEINRALAKAMAYKQCGKETEANEWAIQLLKLLECADIIRPELMG